MAVSSNSRTCVSLFDQELIELLRGVRIIAKEYTGHGTGNHEQLELWNKEHNHKTGKCTMYSRFRLVSCSVYQFYVRLSVIKLTLKEKVPIEIKALKSAFEPNGP